MPGAEIGNQLRNLLVGERFAEGRHLLPAVGDLVDHLGRRPILVFAYVDQGRRLLGANSARTMTERAAFVAKKNRAGLFVGHRDCRAARSSRTKKERQNQRRGKLLSTNCHGLIFSQPRSPAVHPLGGLAAWFECPTPFGCPPSARFSSCA
jgi:hypothetical protein